MKSCENQKNNIKQNNEQNQKIQKILEDNKIKISELENKLKENQKQKNEQENLEKKYEDMIRENINQIKESLKAGSIKKGMNETFKELYNFIDNHFNGLSKQHKHDGIKCEKCFDEPIKGYRYKCTVCNDYNLCEKCIDKKVKK